MISDEVNNNLNGFNGGKMFRDVINALVRVYRYQVGLSARLKPWFVFQEIKAKATNNKKPYKITHPRSRHPLLVRPCTSDIIVFKLVFSYDEYSCINDLGDVKFIVDCGANAGYSTAYFLTKYENAMCVSVEPDVENYKLMVDNLKPFGNRVKTILGGVWSHSCFLRTVANQYRGGHKYAIQVEECEKDSPDAIPAFDILTILKESSHRRISLLKVDIEGAEVVLFSSGCENWLPYIDNIVIEIHDDTFFGPATELVLEKIRQQSRFDISRSGELYVFKSTEL